MAKIEMPIYKIVVTPPELLGKIVQATNMIMGSVAPAKKPASDKNVKKAQVCDIKKAMMNVKPPIKLVRTIKNRAFLTVSIIDAMPLLITYPKKKMDRISPDRAPVLPGNVLANVGNQVTIPT